MYVFLFKCDAARERGVRCNIFLRSVLPLCRKMALYMHRRKQLCVTVLSNFSKQSEGT